MSDYDPDILPRIDGQPPLPMPRSVPVTLDELQGDTSDAAGARAARPWTAR